MWYELILYNPITWILIFWFVIILYSYIYWYYKNTFELKCSLKKLYKSINFR